MTRNASPTADVQPSVVGTQHVSRHLRPEGTRVRLGSLEIGGPGFVVMAGPCAVENRAQTEASAQAVAEAGAHVLRGGAFKPRTSPYAFQGLGEPGLHVLSEAGRKVGLPVISEVMDAEQLPLMLDTVDVLQVGARNMQNFSLLRALGRLNKPVLLKRGLAATVEEWFLAAEYILDGGNDQVLLCERGIRTFETATRNTLDLSAVVLAKQRTHLPVIVDPSHATGLPELILPLSLAAAAAGADGLLVEVHAHPEAALCDGAQALSPAHFRQLMQKLPAVLAAVDRSLFRPAVTAHLAEAR